MPLPVSNWVNIPSLFVGESDGVRLVKQYAYNALRVGEMRTDGPQGGKGAQPQYLAHLEYDDSTGLFFYFVPFVGVVAALVLVLLFFLVSHSFFASPSF